MKKALLLLCLVFSCLVTNAQQIVTSNGDKVCTGEVATYRFQLPARLCRNDLNWQILPEEQASKVSVLEEGPIGFRGTEYFVTLQWDFEEADTEIETYIEFSSECLSFSHSFKKLTVPFSDQLPIQLLGSPVVNNGEISGAASVSVGETQKYTFAAEELKNIHGYKWYLDDELLARFTSEPEVTVSFNQTVSSHTLKCIPIAKCGEIAEEFEKIINVKPIPITAVEGYRNVCTGSEFLYEVKGSENAENFDWTLPSGVSKTNLSADARKVLLSFSNSGYKDIKVAGNNEGGESNTFAFTVHAEQPVQVIRFEDYQHDELLNDPKAILHVNSCADEVNYCTAVNTKVKLRVKFGFAGTYNWGQHNFAAGLSLQVSTSGLVDNHHETKDLSITHDIPEQVYSYELSGEEAAKVKSFVVQLANYSLNDPANSALKDDLIVEVSYENIEEVAIHQLSVSGTSAVQPAGSWQGNFSWTPNQDCNASIEYQFQVTRLKDLSLQAQAMEHSWAGWKNASNLFTALGESQMSLNLAEGSGIYVWRVRPIGTLKGRKTNPNNYGQWSSVQSFDFTQPDEGKNWIYSRIHTEENHQKEQLTFANGLQQVQQQQTQLNSQNNLILSQTVQDFSGRDALQSLPIPLQNGQFGYKEKVLTSDGTNPFTADYFDTEENLRTGNTARDKTDYYSGELVVDENGKPLNERVASAEGYPYSRTLFTKDATGRVKEQAGAGLTHSLAGNKTVKTFYTGVADEEIARLFGMEAPEANNVHKVMTVDANNVTSVQYQDKNGKTLATALSLGSGSGALEDLPSSEGAMRGINQDVNEKAPFGSTGSSSSVPLVFTAPTAVTLSYLLLPNKVEELCQDFCNTCDYQVSFIFHNEDDPALSKTYSYDIPSGTSCSDIASWTPPAPLVEVLNGSYVIEKRVLSYARDPADGKRYIDKQVATLQEKYESSIDQELSELLGYLDNNEIEAAYTFLLNGGFALENIGEQAFFRIPLACEESILLPYHNETCEEESCDIANPADFRAYFDEYWSTNGREDFVGTDENGKLFFAPNYTPTQLDDLISNMLTELPLLQFPGEQQLSCQEFWANWQNQVHNYDLFVENDFAVDFPEDFPMSGAYTPDYDFLGSFFDSFKGMERLSGLEVKDLLSVTEYEANKTYAYKYLFVDFESEVVKDVLELAMNEHFCDERIIGEAECALCSCSDATCSNFANLCPEVRLSLKNALQNGQAQISNEEAIAYAETQQVQFRDFGLSACEKRRAEFSVALKNRIYENGLYIEGDVYEIELNESLGIYATSGKERIDPSQFDISNCEFEEYVNALVVHCSGGVPETFTLVKDGNGRLLSFGTEEEIAALQKVMFNDFDVLLPDDVGSCGTGYEAVFRKMEGSTETLKSNTVHGNSTLSLSSEEQQVSDTKTYTFYDKDGNLKTVTEKKYTGPYYDYSTTYKPIEETESQILDKETSMSILSAHEPQIEAICGFNTAGFTEIDFSPAINGPRLLDDDFTNLIPIGFDFNFFGESYNEVYISINGVISFDQGVSSYEPEGFPTRNHGRMIAPFWGDVDLNGSGRVFFRAEEHRFTVIWENVGYYNSGSDLLNTFKVVITDGEDPDVGLNTNVLFAYGDMNWATQNGFGRQASTVGANNGEENELFFQLGRFSFGNDDYDGPGGEEDGVGYLHDRCLRFNLTDDNIPPIVQGLPENSTIDLEVGEVREFSLDFLAPELEQTTDISIDKSISGIEVVQNTRGNPSTITIHITGGWDNIGSNTISITGRDNGSPTRATMVNLTVNVVNNTPCTAGQLNKVCFKWDDNPRQINLPDAFVDHVFTAEPKECNEIIAGELLQQLESEKSRIISQKLDAFKASYQSQCPAPESLNDQFSLSYDLGYHHFTLYYYDRSGNLMRTVPPEGVDKEFLGHNLATAKSTLPAHSLVTNYQYNSLGQITRQNTPDAGETRFYYDDLGQLRFSQNARQQLAETYSYTKFDQLGRIVEVGESTHQPDALSGQVNNIYFPEEAVREVTKTVYNDAAAVSYLNGEAQRFLQNRISFTYLDEDGDAATKTDRSYTYYSYDVHGNVAWLVQDIAGLGKNYLAYEYDLLSGNVRKVRYNEGKPDQFFHQYEYDADNRILSVKTSRDEVIWEQDASYEYYAHGPLKRTELGQDGLQGIDYTYTIHGWLKALNHPSLALNDPGKDGMENSLGKDAFGMALTYYNDDYVNNGQMVFTAPKDNTDNGNGGGGGKGKNKPKNENGGAPKEPKESNKPAFGAQDPYIEQAKAELQLYNGNIAAWTSQTKNYKNTDLFPEPGLNAQPFSYDELNRIKTAGFKTHNGNTFQASKDYAADYSYDANGNLLSLNRDAHGANPLMDRLSYQYYEGTNKLRKVSDEVDADLWEVDVDHQVDEFNYTYDAIGNLISDKAEGISKIEWTVYGKVKAVQKDDGSSIIFTYDASGNRIRKELMDAEGLPGQTTYYVRDASGNTMGVYKEQLIEEINEDGRLLHTDKVLTLAEQPIYGSDRLGQRTEVVEVRIERTEPDKAPYLLDPNVTLKTTFTNWVVPLDTESGSATASLSQSSGTPTVTSTSSGISTTGLRTVAMGEDMLGTLQFSLAVADEMNGQTNLALVLDKNGNLMPGSAGLASGRILADAQSPAAITQGSGNSLYYIYTLGADERLYRHTVDMKAAGNGSAIEPLGAVIATNKQLDSEAQFAPAMAVLALNGGTDAKNILYLLRKASEGLELVSFRVGGNTSGSQVEDSFSGNAKGAKLQLDQSGRHLAVVAPQGEPIGWYGATTGGSQLRVYQLNTEFNTPQLLKSVHMPEQVLVNSIDFASDYQYIYYTSSSPLYGHQLERVHIFTGLPEVLQATDGIAELRRGSDGTLYASVEGSQELLAITHDATAPTITAQALALPDGTSLTGTMPLQPITRYLELQLQDRVFARQLNGKVYELKDHLGNVRALISDRKLSTLSEGLAADFRPDVTAYHNYYPFGMDMPGLSKSEPGEGYRYGFNGKEKDDETGWQDYGFRIYKPQIAKFLSVDPLTKEYPELTPYQFASNTPIQAIDLDGLEAFFVHGTNAGPEMWTPKLTNFLRENLTNNKTPDNSFRWNYREGPTKRNWLLNSENKRRKAAGSLVMHVINFRKENNITDEEITFVTHSHGGNVAIQAAKLLYDNYGIQVNIVNINTPVYNKRGDAEDPDNNSGINELIHYYTEGDAVAGQIAPGSDDKYNFKVNTDVTNIQLTDPKDKGPIGAHLMDNVNLEELKKKAQKPSKIYKGLRNPENKNE